MQQSNELLVCLLWRT